MKVTISGDVDFIRRINNSNFSGVVHSTFNRTFNIQCSGDGELFTIACRMVDNAPNTLIIDSDDLSSWGIEVNDRVFVKNNTLYIENKLAILVEKARIWASAIPAYPCNIDTLSRNLKTIKEYIDAHGKEGGIKKKPTVQNSFEAELARMLELRTSLLWSELLKNHKSQALKHAVSLVGLGPGLTPSGDDFLVGLFTAINMIDSPFYDWRPFCEAVTKKARHLTNDISYTTLEKAAMGKVRESIINLVNSLIADNEEDLILSLNKVFNIGSSSGTDIALGLVCGLEANIIAGGKV
ncbi:DUF2877 domain-containing protein [Neobacillus kokaensis]|uniref:DUF2877 domain-containing protein n=1 Tax=Neobacillus kokaensis TaxID=2759023 RepID=A0ABQ3N8V1_9BACI|nr:DUF2877 domain-containing protein [Neobacillus kokaensis]GHI00582.1 hypothetical protein AM1BK_41240 [Neobacillus kokaensis]